MAESIKFIPVGVRGCHAMAVSGSDRLWRELHERHCITLVTDGLARWRYRGRYADASPRSIMLMEPGEIHVNTSVERAGSFFAMCFSPEHLADLTGVYADAPVHFKTESLASAPSIARLSAVALGAEKHEPQAQEELLCLAVSGIVREASESPGHLPAKARTNVRNGARLLREVYTDTPWKVVDIRSIAAAADMSYHWFVHSFREEFGLPPYQFVQALRRSHARRLFAVGPSREIRTLGDVAAAAGYADAPHLARDCRQAWGVPPSRIAPALHPGWG